MKKLIIGGKSKRRHGGLESQLSTALPSQSGHLCRPGNKAAQFLGHTLHAVCRLMQNIGELQGCQHELGYDARCHVKLCNRCS